MPEAEFSADRDLIAEATVAAGAIARAAFGGKVRHWDKSKGNPVSETDLAVNDALKAALLKARPNYGWLSEESADDPHRLHARRLFIVDPIDGTIAFLKGKPEFVIAVAVAEAGRPVAAAIYDPIGERLFTAAEHAGAALNGTAIAVTARSALADARVLAPKTLFQHPGWAEPWPAMDVVQRHSVALRMALVAAGEADAAVALSPKQEWDVAGADLLIREAGGLVTDHTGRPYAYNQAVPRLKSLVAAGPSLHAQILARTRPINLS